MFARYFPDRAYPTNTLVIVSGLVRLDLIVEIEGMAIKSSSNTVPPTGVRAKRPARRRTRR